MYYIVHSHILMVKILVPKSKTFHLIVVLTAFC